MDKHIMKDDFLAKLVKYSGKQIFSFNYDNIPSSSFIFEWDYEYKKKSMPEYNLHTIIYTDPKTKLSAVIKAKEYRDYPAIWWHLVFKNNSDKNSLIISEAKTINADIENTDASTLHYAKGSLSEIDDFINYSKELVPGEELKLITHGGRSSQENLPYFNLAGPKHGIIGAIAWSGQWCAAIKSISKNNINISAGIENIHTYLKPKEEIRLPGICLLFWDGDIDSGHNNFRQFQIKHNSPRINNQPVEVPVFLPHMGRYDNRRTHKKN